MLGLEKQGNIIQPRYLSMVSGSGLCYLLLSKVTEELTHELQDKVDATFPGVYYLFCVCQTLQVNSSVLLYFEKKKRRKKRKKKTCVCCSGEYFNIWNSQPV